VIVKGKGATLTDADGNEYVDYVGGQGALILGHADERVVAAISKAASKGFGFAAPVEAEFRLAELIAGRHPSIDMLRLTNTPAEALAGALALARGKTGRTRAAIIRSDRRHARDSAHFDFVPYNDAEAVEALFRTQGENLAAVVVEPLSTDSGLVQPDQGYLRTLWQLCHQHQALLIFDETVTGFRLPPDEFALAEGVSPDLTVLGPIVGGGLALGAYGGAGRVMRRPPNDAGLELRAFSNQGTAAACTASNSLVAIAAGIATLQAIGEPGFYDILEEKASRLDDGLRAASAAFGMPRCRTRVGSMLGIFFSENVTGRGTADRNYDFPRYARFHEAMLDRGVLLPSSQLSCIFLSSAHTDEDIDRTIEAVYDALRTETR